MAITQAIPTLEEKSRIAVRLDALNDCAPEMACIQFKRCCGSSRWASRMEQARPFLDMAHLEGCADREWGWCSREDWLEAFAAHPKIGDRSDNRWSQEEQAGAESAAPDVLAAFADANRRYEEKFGYIFIVCATGKGAAEMLALLEKRLDNSPQEEIKNAAEQQRLILRLRLRKVLGE